MRKRKTKEKINKVWFAANLIKVEKLAAKTGKIKDIEEFIGTSNATLHYYRKKHPVLDEAIQKGKLQYETKCNLALTSKATKKATKVLIASLSSVEDNSGQALAAYRRKKIEEHESRLQTQVRSNFGYMI